MSTSERIETRAPLPPILELAQRDPAAAVRLLRARTAREPNNLGAQRLLGRLLRGLGRDDEAARAEMAAIRAAAHDPEMIAIAHALLANDLPAAEAGLRRRLAAQPTDVAAIRMMAELGGRLGRYRDAENLLRRAIELAPSFTAAQANLAMVLYRQSRYAEAGEMLEQVLARDPGHSGNRNLLAATLGRMGDYDEALVIYRELVQTFPDHAKLWMSYGHMLKTVGMLDESVAAYRRALDVEPHLGEVWWSLANLKTVKFEDADIAAMEAALAAQIAPVDALHLHFALGKAWQDRRDAAQSFHHYAAGNALRSIELGYKPEATTRQIDRMIEVLTPEFLEERKGVGDPAPDPIFILGLPRAGSTLLEQILASHSAIEGTMELPDIPAMALREARAGGDDLRDWPHAVAEMTQERFAELGAEFLERTRIQRKTGKPFYIDKLPNNWNYVGFIHLILPGAKIIDARRNPLDCCFSNFRQHFAKGQAFSYSLDHIGRYYADYVRAMDHYDRVLPGRIHRVIHERLLDSPEAEVRAMLDYLGLPFEEACLEFHRNTRAVRTASSEQVRRPINRDGLGQWEAYDAWLGPLREALGDLVDTYADRPD